MVQKKSADKRGVPKLKLKKETIRNLDAKRGAEKVKGGAATGMCARMTGTACLKKDTL